MNTAAQLMKAAINANLQLLVNSGVLKGFIEADYSKTSVFDFTWPGFPAAVVLAPTISKSEYEDTVTNKREYEWNILVVTTPDNMPNDPMYLEGLVDSVLNIFDLDCTLNGSSVAAVSPSVLMPPGPVNNGSVTYVLFYVTLHARALIPAAVKSA
jgi:hypothetical protein